MEPRLKAERESHPELFEYAFKLEGLLRHASRHAAGVVISDVPLAEVVPLYADKERADGAMAITQYSMKGVEEIGLIKFDFLALKNLTLDCRDPQPGARRRQGAAGFEPPAPRRSRELPIAGARRHGRRVPDGRVGDAPLPDRAQAVEFRGRDRGDLAVPSGHAGLRDGRAVHPSQARQGAGRIRSSAARAGAARHLRRHHLPGAGDARGAGAGRLYARGSRYPARRDGQEEQGRRWSASASAFIDGRNKERPREGARANRSSRRSKPSPPTDSTARTPPPTRSPPTPPRT